MQSKFGQSLTNHEGVNTSGYKDTVFRTNCSVSVELSWWKEVRNSLQNNLLIRLIGFNVEGGKELSSKIINQ